MPTGYTADVKDGKITEFPEFAMRCARAFGALVEMRDAPNDAKVPERFEPSSYYAEQMEERRATVERLRTMTVAEADEAAESDYRENVERVRKWNAEKLETENRYKAMLAKVVEWEPPSEDHVELKKFMLQQLHESINFDCGEPYAEPVRKTAEVWLAEQIAEADRRLAYISEEYAKELKRVENRNRWLAELRSSLASRFQPNFARII